VRLKDLGTVAMGWTRRDAQLWQLTGLGILVSLAIVGPTFWWEESWSGAPLIDRGGFLWLFPSTIMALGFFLGGAVAGVVAEGSRLPRFKASRRARRRSE
jgi:hypothetical protein